MKIYLAGNLQDHEKAKKWNENKISNKRLLSYYYLEVFKHAVTPFEFQLIKEKNRKENTQ